MNLFFRCFNYFSILFLVSFFIITFSIIFFNFKKEDDFDYHKRSLSINKNEFLVEVAYTQEKKNLGLGQRKSICENCGMLFIFPEKNYYNFWMKDMNFDLDILWLNDNEIVYIEKNVSCLNQEKVYFSNKKANSVLELKSGLVEKLNIKIGDEIVSN